MDRASANHATQAVKAAIKSGDAGAMRAAMLYPGSSTPLARERSKFLAEALRHGFRPPAATGGLNAARTVFKLFPGSFTPVSNAPLTPELVALRAHVQDSSEPETLLEGDLSLLEVCLVEGQYELLKIALEADHLACELCPYLELDARREWWLEHLSSHYDFLDEGFKVCAPLKLCLKSGTPHAVDFLRTLIDFREPHWDGFDRSPEGSALLTEARMQAHITVLLAGESSQTAPFSPAVAEASSAARRLRAL